MCLPLAPSKGGSPWSLSAAVRSDQSERWYLPSIVNQKNPGSAGEQVTRFQVQHPDVAICRRPFHLAVRDAPICAAMTSPTSHFLGRTKCHVDPRIDRVSTLLARAHGPFQHLRGRNLYRHLATPRAGGIATIVQDKRGVSRSQPDWILQSLRSVKSRILFRQRFGERREVSLR